jgi:hypothetical protein
LWSIVTIFVVFVVCSWKHEVKKEVALRFVANVHKIFSLPFNVFSSAWTS